MSTVQTNSIQWREATRQQAKACIVIEGLAGSGKSGLALLLGYTLAGDNWKDTLGIDTENKSLDLFQGINTSTGEVFNGFRKFDLTSMHGYAPSNYYAIKESAKKNGAKSLIIDSASHMWTGAGGVLSLVSDAKSKDPRIDNYRVWGIPNIKHEKDLIVDCIRDSELHIISTVRVKEKFEMVQEDGKSKLNSLGEQQIMMPDLKYEPDLVLTMVSPGTTTGTPPVATVTKSRYAILNKGETYSFTKGLLENLRDYLADGADPEILKEEQRKELITMIKELIDSDKSKETMLPYLKENLNVKDKPITELSLPILKQLYSLLIS